jgi:hypothetical protein
MVHQERVGTSSESLAARVLNLLRPWRPRALTSVSSRSSTAAT